MFPQKDVRVFITPSSCLVCIDYFRCYNCLISLWIRKGAYALSRISQTKRIIVLSPEYAIDTYVEVKEWLYDFEKRQPDG